MEKTAIGIVLVFILPFVPRLSTTLRKFTCGLVNGYPEEYDALTLAGNKTNKLNNVSVIFKQFNISDKINLFSKASLLRDENVIALVEGSEDKISTCALSTVTGIPLIRLHDNKVSDQCEKVIQMSAGYKDIATATLALINMFHWESIAVLFDEDYSYKAAFFTTITKRLNLAIKLVHFSTEPNNENAVFNAMDEIYNLEAEVILLHIKKENIEIILNQQRTCQCTNVYKWILQGEVIQLINFSPPKNLRRGKVLSCISNPNFLTLSLTAHIMIPLHLTSEGNNIVFALKLPSYYEEENVVKGNNTNTTDQDALLQDTSQIIHQALSREECLSVNSSSFGFNEAHKMLSCLKNVKFEGKTGPVYFDEYGERRGIRLEILNLQNDSLTTIGTWNSSHGAVVFGNVLRNDGNPLSGRRLEGKKLRVVVVENAPFIMKNEDGTIPHYKGYCIDLLDELAKNLKFTYEIYLSPDGMYGAELENGTWNGMIGELVGKRADIAVASLTVTESREKIVDFSVPYMYYSREILVKKSPHSGKVDLLQFMNPFDIQVWFATLASLVIISVAVFVINYFSPYGCKDENGRGTSEEFNFFNSVWFALACMLQQGGDNTPKSSSGRILTGCYWFCILIMISTYTANLAAFLVVKDNDNPINNLEDIVRSTYQVAVIESGSTYEAFRTSQYVTHEKIWNRMVTAGSFVQSTAEGIQMVRDRDQFVFISDGPVLKHAAQQPPCDVTTVPGLSTALGLAFAFQANSTDVDDVTLAILHLHENEFLDSLKREWWEYKDECPKKQDTTLTRKRIDLRSMLGVYVVMSVGLILALMALTAEIFWTRMKERKIITQRPEDRSIEVNQIAHPD
nr:glutamate receptor 2-like [Pocillopora verrucosa]